MAMNREFSEEYMELLLTILEAAARAAVVTGRVVSQQALKQAVKPAGWRPRNQQERESHVAVRGKDGKTIGFVDKNSPLVEELERRADPAGAGRGHGGVTGPAREADGAGEQRTATPAGGSSVEAEGAGKSRFATLGSALAIGGAAFIGVEAARAGDKGGQMSVGQVLSEEEARAFLDEAGWQWVDADNPVMVEGKPAYVSGPASIELVGGVDEVVVAEGTLVSERGFEGANVKVAGHGTVGGQEIDAWDAEFEAMAAEGAPELESESLYDVAHMQDGPMFEVEHEQMSWA